ncbi:hypothetical protein PR048_004481 [Dryococelus australis]|uniref:Uncharacterized protein n=1 Tax=Dryococelus australis TaxID=614101 RepID=A0ABQ9I607_9NEOP|nr:hypothetical protein PR048_004481 [Dryococelus australis]
MEQRRNARVEKMRDIQENSPTSGIVPNDSHLRKPGSDLAGDRTRVALVGVPLMIKRSASVLDDVIRAVLPVRQPPLNVSEPLSSSVSRVPEELPSAVLPNKFLALCPVWFKDSSGSTARYLSERPRICEEEVTILLSSDSKDVVLFQEASFIETSLAQAEACPSTEHPSTTSNVYSGAWGSSSEGEGCLRKVATAPTRFAAHKGGVTFDVPGKHPFPVRCSGPKSRRANVEATAPLTHWDCVLETQAVLPTTLHGRQISKAGDSDLGIFTDVQAGVLLRNVTYTLFRYATSSARGRPGEKRQTFSLQGIGE